MSEIQKDRQILAGVAVPDTELVASALAYARRACEPYLYNHVVRSWLFAARLGQLRNIHHDEEVVAVGTLLHDVTLNERFNGPRRFEVEGADLARSFARESGVDERRAQLIWDSVALNSTPSIGLYKEAEVALCTAGICLDVVGLQHDALPPDEVQQILLAYPRLGMKRLMTQCFATSPEPVLKPPTTISCVISASGSGSGLPRAVVGRSCRARAVRRVRCIPQERGYQGDGA